MNDAEKRLKSIVRLDLLFVIAGLIEVFLLVFLTNKFYFLIIGLITALAANRAMKPGKVKWNYFLGIWSLVKYNPITLAIIFFVLGDMAGPFGGFGLSDLEYVLMIFTILVTLALFLFSFIAGIVIIVKTSRYSDKK